MTRISGKICTIHGELNETNASLHPAPWNKEYLRWRCRECGKARSKEWREKNHEHHLAEVKKWNKENRDLILIRQREARKKDPERFKEYEKKKREKGGQRYKDYFIEQRFNITLERYYEMVKEQNNKCYLCKNPETRTHKGKITRLAIDHNHSTNIVRKLLCHACNVALGSFRENTDLLRRAITYLESHNLEDKNK